MATATTDRLEPLGIGFGVLLVLVGIATLVGTPWAHKSGGALLLVGQAFGAIAAVGIGAGLAWLAKA
ncbi:hypothetical protein [Halorussus amylolyticus]|uniref:hypothetical protein n=1 Tax=Halorussus amylolyticus TaxID=1126242 RepID=UPI0010535F1E|nr:hypothetical protein [Halorussus amylolyticus]